MGRDFKYHRFIIISYFRACALERFRTATMTDKCMLLLTIIKYELVARKCPGGPCHEVGEIRRSRTQTLCWLHTVALPINLQSRMTKWARECYLFNMAPGVQGLPSAYATAFSRTTIEACYLWFNFTGAIFDTRRSMFANHSPSLPLVVHTRKSSTYPGNYTPLSVRSKT